MASVFVQNIHKGWFLGYFLHIWSTKSQYRPKRDKKAGIVPEMIEHPHDKSTCKCHKSGSISPSPPAKNGNNYDEQKQNKPHRAHLTGNLQKKVVCVHNALCSANGIMRIHQTPSPFPHTNSKRVFAEHTQCAAPSEESIANRALAKITDAEQSPPKILRQNGGGEQNKQR